jgi:hypothetical protein
MNKAEKNTDSIIRTVKLEFSSVLQLCVSVCSIVVFLYFKLVKASNIQLLVNRTFILIVLMGLLIGFIYALSLLSFLVKKGKLENIRGLVILHRPALIFIFFPFLRYLNIESIFYISIVASFYFSCFLFYRSIYREQTKEIIRLRFPSRIIRNNISIFILGILCSAVTVILLLFIFSKFYNPNVEGILEIGKALIKPEILTGAAPKPQERAMYVIVCVLAVPIITIWYFVLRKLFEKINNRFSFNIFLLIMTGSVFLVANLIIKDFSSTTFNYLQSSVLTRHLWIYMAIVVPLVIFMIFLWEKYKLTLKINVSSIVLFLYIFLVALILFLANVFSYNTYSGPNLNAALYSVSQVFQGKTILVNVFSQYGLYPHFLEPVFIVTGFSVSIFSIIMSLINAIAFSLAILSLKKIIKNPIILLLTSTAFVYITIFLIQVTFERMIYYANWPIRILPPCIALLLVSRFLFNPSKRKYFIIWVLVSFSIAWNADTGIVVYLSWLALLFYNSFLKKTGRERIRAIGKHFSAAVCFILLTFICVSLFLYLRSGAFPNFGNFFMYQYIFTSLGYNMLFMPPFHPWNLVFLIYLAGLFISIRANLETRSTPVSQFIFFLSILGIGLFSYYEGRSHDYVFVAVVFPAIFLLGIFVNELVNDWFLSRKRTTVHFLGVIALLVVLAVPFSDFFLNIDRIYSLAHQGISAFKNKEVTALDREISFLKSYLSPKEKVLILKEHSEGVLYAETGTVNFAPLPGSTETFLLSDMKTQFDYIEKNSLYKIVVDANYEAKYKSVLDKRYNLLASSVEGLKIMIPK